MTVPSRPNGGDLSTGDAAPSVEIPSVQRRHFVQFAGASGDFNPIHYDEPYAISHGHESVFGQGMFSAGLVAHAVADWFGLVNVTDLRMRFQSSLYPGMSVKTIGKILEVDPGRDAVVVKATVDLVTGEGTRIVSGHARAAVPY